MPNTLTDDVKFKNPCITVTYSEETKYHIDITVYANNNPDGKMYLARGKRFSTEENREWESSNPQGFIEAIKNHFNDSKDREQFRRIIRYLKRWKDFQFNSTVNGEPTGIALTIAAYDHFQVNKDYDFTEHTYKYNDLGALIDFIRLLRQQFSERTVFNPDTWKMETCYALSLFLPKEPYNDVLEKMSDIQTSYFYEKLGLLLDKLEKASQEVDPVVAAEELQKVFGDDFGINLRHRDIIWT